MKKHVRRPVRRSLGEGGSSLSAGGISQYIGIIVSITLLAHGTVLFGSEPQKGRLARAWKATKEYASKATKRVGLDNPKERARNTIQNYASRAQASLKKFIVCLEGKAGCSREDIRKVRLYTAIVITAITILGIGYKVSQKQKDGEIESKAPPKRPIDEEEGEKKITPIEDIARNAESGLWQSFAVTFDYHVIHSDLKIDWKSDEGHAIAERAHGFWNKLPSKTKFNLEKLGFPANADEKEDLESMRSKEENLHIIKRNIDSLLDITEGRSDVDIQRAMIGLNFSDYQALKDFLDGPLSEWIHKNWRTFNDETKQALQKSAFILNEDERTDLARIKEYQRRKKQERERERAEEQAEAKKRAEVERVRLEIERRSKAEAEKRQRQERKQAEVEQKKETRPPSPKEPEKPAARPPGSTEPMEVEEPKSSEPAAEGWGAWIANWWNPPPSE